MAKILEEYDDDVLLALIAFLQDATREQLLILGSSSAPPAAPPEKEAGSGSMVVGMVIGAAVGFILGYAFAKRKDIMKALGKALAKVTGAAKAASAEKSAAGKGEDEEEKDEDDDGTMNEAQSVLEEFLMRDNVPGLDDHPDTYVSPIITYQIKKSTEAIRTKKLIDAILAEREAEGDFEPGYLESLSDEERRKLGERLIKERGAPTGGTNVGSVTGFERTHGATQNSMAILVQAGLRQASGKDKKDQNEDAKKAQELRDKMRSIDKYLSVDMEIDVARDQGAARKAPGAGGGNALQKANATKVDPVKDIAEVLRYEERLDFAQRGRKRVGPPLDHLQPGRSGKSRGSGARGSGSGSQFLESGNKVGEPRLSASQGLPKPDDE